MKQNKNHIIGNESVKRTMKLLGAAFFILQSSLFISSCSDILDTDSELVEFEEDNTLNHATDSVYSVMGIVERMQFIADRVVLLGEVRSDLVKTTEAANADLKRLASFDFSQANKYNQVSDYYAVINNCNYFLAHIDTTLQRRGRTIFTSEYAAVKAFRAWTYLELAKAYGRVPFVLQPVMTELDAEAAAAGPTADIQEVCKYFIDDLTPYAYTEVPQFGEIYGMDSKRFYIPMRLLLGDLCLWAGRYQEAAQWYFSYLNNKDMSKAVRMNSGSRVVWTNPAEFNTCTSYYNPTDDKELLSFIPMEKMVFAGVISDLQNVFCSTRDNKNYYQVSPSTAMRNLSADQIYCMEHKTDISTDTIYAPRTGFYDDIYVGDLRLKSNYSLSSNGAQDPYSDESAVVQRIDKVNNTKIPLYRRNMVYLRYAEALNRAGLPQSAFAVLKYGLCKENIYNYVDSIEQVKAGDLIAFDETNFTRDGENAVIGIHSIGSGDSQCNAYYTLPQPATQLATREDTVAYQIPLVEDLIINEMALEGAFEGYRYYDLMRVALRRGDASYLADPVSRRNGAADESLRALLMDQKNWYLPLK